MLKLWDYQQEAISQMQAAFREGHKIVVLVQPTGSGKTITSMTMIEMAIANGFDTAFLCERRVLVTQAIRTANRLGIRAGAVMANIPRAMWERGVRKDASAPLQVCSRETLRSRGDVPKVKLLVVDEAHRWGSEGSQEIIAEFVSQGAWVIYLTATPILANGKTMGTIKNELAKPTKMIQVVKPSQLIASGQLTACRCFLPFIPDLKGLDPDQDNAITRAKLDEIMGKESLMDDVVEKYQECGQGRKFLYFGYSVDDSRKASQKFNNAGIRCEHVDASVDDDLREQWYEQVRKGELDGICNYDVCTTGFDLPEISCLIYRRPTKNAVLKIQMDGRGMRAAPGKTDCIILDHAGVLWYHGRPGQDIEYTLEPDFAFNSFAKKLADEDENRMINCPQCGEVYSGGRKCPFCGYLLPMRTKTSEEIEGTPMAQSMVELDPDKSQKDNSDKGADFMQKKWLTFLAVAVKSNQKLGVAASRFSQMFGLPPWRAGVEPMPEGEGIWQKKAREVFPNWGKK